MVRKPPADRDPPVDSPMAHIKDPLHGMQDIWLKPDLVTDLALGACSKSERVLVNNP